MNILAITPHPDDLELGCSGTLLKLRDKGANIDVIITVKPSAEINSNRNAEIVERELQRSMQILNFNYKVFDTPTSSNGRPLLTHDNNTVTKIEQMLDKKHYDLIITTDPGDYHQDHSNTFKIANSICRGVSDELWTMEISPYSHRNIDFEPNIFVDVSDFMTQKINSLKCYESYISDKHINVTKSLAMYRSSVISDASYVETFNQKFRVIT